MEAGGIPFKQWLDERFRSFDTRIRSNHDTIGAVRDKQGKQGESLIKIEGKLDEQSTDITEMKEDMKWIKRGLFGAIAVGLMFVVAVAALVAQVAG